MTRRLATLVLLLSALIMMAGCAGDPVKAMLANADTRARILDSIATDPVIAGDLLDRMMAGDATRALLVDKVLGNGDVAQALMARIAKDQTMVDGVLSFAAQDSTMRAHLMGVLKGLQMAGGK